MSVHIIGIDPGLVDTGVVRMIFKPTIQVVDVSSAVVSGIDPMRIKSWSELVGHSPRFFVEKYRPRRGYGTDERMVMGEHDLRRTLPKAEFLDNTGIRKVVRPQVLQLLGAWSFSRPTHHQDLRSAARIAVLGMLKDEELNHLLADVVAAELDGDPWEVTVHDTAVV